jgi:hypothetical protein
MQRSLATLYYSQHRIGTEDPAVRSPRYLFRVIAARENRHCRECPPAFGNWAARPREFEPEVSQQIGVSVSGKHGIDREYAAYYYYYSEFTGRDYSNVSEREERSKREYQLWLMPKEGIPHMMNFAKQRAFKGE